MKNTDRGAKFICLLLSSLHAASSCTILGVILLSACGKMALPKNSQLTLAGGAVAARGEFTGALLFSGPFDGDSYNCSGSKVSDTLILTAAHCAYNFASNKEMLAAGSEIEISFAPEVKSKSDSFKSIVKSVKIHSSNFDPKCIASESIERYQTCIDVALIEIEPTAQFSAEKSAKVGFGYVPKITSPVYIGGYGCEKWDSKFNPVFSSNPPRQKFALMGIDSIHSASIGFRSGPVTNFVDASGTPLDIPMRALGCPGDSGGPVYLEDKSTVVAVTSGAVEANIDLVKGFSGYYSRIDANAIFHDGDRLEDWLSPLLTAHQ